MSGLALGPGATAPPDGRVVSTDGYAKCDQHAQLRRHGGHGARSPHVPLSGERHHERQPADRGEQSLRGSQVARRDPERLRDGAVPGVNAAAAADRQHAAGVLRRPVAMAVRGHVRVPRQERGQGKGRRALPGAGRARLRRGLLRARGHRRRRGQAGDAHALRRARADHRGAQPLRGPRRRAVGQPADPGDAARAGQRADPRHHRAGPRPPAGLPAHLRDHAQRREGAGQAARRANAGADLAARVRPVGAGRRPLLRGDEDGGARPASPRRTWRSACRSTSG